MLEELAQEVAYEHHEFVQAEAINAKPFSAQALHAHREVQERHL